MSDEEVEKRFLENDPGILALIYEQFAKAALGFLLKKYPQTDDYIIKDIICDSLIALADSPEKYQSEKASLKTFIFRDIEGNLINELEKAKRPRNRFKQKGVELSEISGNVHVESSPISMIEFREIKEKVEGFFLSIFQNERDRKLAWMIAIEKERRTEEYHDILELSNVNLDERADLVKQHKDRITIRLKRNGWEEFIKDLRSDV